MTDLANLNSDGLKLDIDKLKIAPNNLNNLKNKVDELDIGKLKTTPVGSSKLSEVVKLLKGLNIMNYLKGLIILILLIRAT